MFQASSISNAIDKADSIGGSVRIINRELTESSKPKKMVDVEELITNDEQFLNNIKGIPQVKCEKWNLNEEAIE